MDALAVTRLVAGLALAMYLPGWALLAWLHPHRPVTVAARVERAFLAVVLSLAVLVVLTVPLVYGPWRLADGRGLFQGSTTGAPVLEGLLLGATLLFGLAAWLRTRQPVPYPTPPVEEGAQHAAADAVEQGQADPAEVAEALYGHPDPAPEPVQRPR